AAGDAGRRPRMGAGAAARAAEVQVAGETGPARVGARRGVQIEPRAAGDAARRGPYAVRRGDARSGSAAARDRATARAPAAPAPGGAGGRDECDDARAGPLPAL